MSEKDRAESHNISFPCCYHIIAEGHLTDSRPDRLDGSQGSNGNQQDGHVDVDLFGAAVGGEGRRGTGSAVEECE